jgi:TPR repeat protein
MSLSCRSRRSGVKRPRTEQLPKPLTLLALVKSHLGTHVCAQLCNKQGVALFSFVGLPPRVPHPFAGAPVYGMSLTHADRLRVVGCGFKGKLVRLLSLSVGRHFEPRRNWRACHQMMQSNARRVASKLMAAVRDEAAKEAGELCSSGQCAAALVPMQRAIDFGDLPSRALKAWLLADGRQGVARDQETAFDLAEEGVRLGCHHCQGVMACFYHFGCGCRPHQARSLELARESAARGSRYGQYTLGQLHGFGREGLERDSDQQLVFFRLAAAQGLDAAQYQLGDMISVGYHVVRDCIEGLRWCQRAAAQGYPDALFMVAECHECGSGVAADVAEAIRWYRRAQTAGSTDAAGKLQKLGV